MMSNYLITGGVGFIGSNIVETLVQQGESVRVLDNCTTGRLSNLGSVIDRIEFIQGGIRDPSIVRRAVKNIDYVIHQAGMSSVVQSIDDPILTNEVNVAGTLEILKAAKDANVKRFIYASSASIYGNSPELPKREDTPVDPLSPYAVSKYSGEQYCKMFYRIYSLETVVLRYFNVFGPRQNTQYAAAIPIFIKAFLEGRPPTISGDGEQSRDFVFVRDVVQANLLACHRKDAAGEVFNIASGKRVTINTLVKIIGKLLGSSTELVYGPGRDGDVRHSQADISKAERLLGYKPRFDLEGGLEETIGWFRANSD